MNAPACSGDRQDSAMLSTCWADGRGPDIRLLPKLVTKRLIQIVATIAAPAMNTTTFPTRRRRANIAACSATAAGKPKGRQLLGRAPDPDPLSQRRVPPRPHSRQVADCEAT